VNTLYNTYWVRFDHGKNTQEQAVENTAILVNAAKLAGVRRIVHISITNPSFNAPLPYFRGKALNERIVSESGLSYAILRPTVLFGKEDILINNIAYLLRRFPFFALPGDGNYRLQPIFVDDLAELAVDAGARTENLLWDAVGPDIFTFEKMVQLIGSEIGCRRLLIHAPVGLSLAASKLISLFVGDIILAKDEVDGLMADLLISAQPARARTRLVDWLKEKKSTLGMNYASELKRHYQG